MALTLLRNGAGEILTDSSGNALAINLPSAFVRRAASAPAAGLRTLGSGATSTYAFGAAVLAGSMLVLDIANYPSGIASVTDSLGNTWQRAVTFGDAGDNFAEVWWCASSAAGTPTLTITPTATSDNYLSGYLTEYTITGGGTVLLDRTGTVSSSGVTSTTVSTSAATTAADELAHTVAVVDASTPDAVFSLPADWRLVDVAQDSSTTTGYQAGEQFTPAAGVISVTHTHPGVSVGVDAVIATWRISSGAVPVDTSGTQRGGGREAATAGKIAGGAATGRAGGREQAVAGKLGTSTATQRAGGRQQAAGQRTASASGTSRAGGRLSNTASAIPVGTFTASSRAGGRMSSAASKLASGSGSAGAGGREAAAGSKSTTAAAEQRAGGRLEGLAGKLASTTATQRAGGREEAIATQGPIAVTSATQRAGGRHENTFEASINPISGPGSTGSGEKDAPRRKKRDEVQDPRDRAEAMLREEAERELEQKRKRAAPETAGPDRPEPIARVVVEPVAITWVDEALDPRFGRALPEYGGAMAAIAEAKVLRDLELALERDDAEALALIEAVLSL